MGIAKDQRFTDAYVAHYADVLGYLARRSSVEDARDAAADVFTVAWRRLDEMPGGIGTRPWLYGVAAHVLANQRRGNRRRRDLRYQLDGVVPTTNVGPATVAADAELAVALNSLRRTDREILLLNAWEGLPASQIALRFSISLEAAEKRLTRAKARLGSALVQIERSSSTRPTSNSMEGRTT
jgi:RNA polymerase sigma factor (sigma-70 family)